MHLQFINAETVAVCNAVCPAPAKSNNFTFFQVFGQKNLSERLLILWALVHGLNLHVLGKRLCHIFA